MSQPLFPGTILDGRYQLQRRAGEGPYGEIWSANDTRFSDRPVTVKFLRLDLATQPDIASRFEAEANGAPTYGAPRVLDRGEVGGQRYLIAEGDASSTNASSAFGSLVGMPGAPVSKTVALDIPPQGASAGAPGGFHAPAPAPFAPQPNSAFGPPPANHGSPFGPPPGSPFGPPPGSPFAAHGHFGPPPARAPARSGGVLVTAIVAGVALLGILGVVGAVMLRGSSDPTRATSRGIYAPVNPYGAPGGAAQLDSPRIPVGASPQLGPASALVTIVEFSDFECPFCARVETTLREVRARYGDDVRIVWKNNPLQFHSHARDAAMAAMAAHQQGRFWEMRDLLYQNQRALTRPDLDRYAMQLGLDMVRYQNEMTMQTHGPSIDADVALAATLSASGTPNFFINGTQLTGAQPLARFTAVIDQVLARARSIAPSNQAYAQMVASPVPNGTTPSPTPAPTAPARTLDPSTVYNVPVGNSPTLGSPSAPVTIVEFGDFQCPYCARAEATLAQLRARYGQDLRIVWRNLPLPMHANARIAAEAAMEAMAQRGPSGFWRMHDTLFANQTALSRPDLERYAEAQRLDMARFRNALDLHTHEAEIRGDGSLAAALAATGTPHFFVNGRRLSGAQSVERFIALVDEVMLNARAMAAAGIPPSAIYAQTTAGGANAPVYLPGGSAASAPGATVFRAVRPSQSAPSRGASNARVVIEHFSDFQCPFCSRVDPTLARVLAEYPGRVRIVWRDYPLAFHSNAMLAAEAAREAFAQQGSPGFWRFHDTLFQNQTSIQRPDLERYAEAQGLSLARFRAALDNHVHQAAIREDMAALDASGEAGTPASFINGRYISGAQPFESFRREIDAALAATP